MPDDAPQTLADRLVLAVQREREMTSKALAAGARARFLARVSCDLAMLLDEASTREAVRRCTLMRDGSWVIVDLIESNGNVQRLAVAHPDPAKEAMAQVFADRWFPTLAGAANGNGTTPHPESSEFGLGGFLAVPLRARGVVHGAMTFVTRKDDGPFSSDEVALASELAHICALALHRARLYRESEALRAHADEASRAKSRFLSNVNHELMTPLNAIRGYVTLMEMGLRGPVSDEQRADLARIEHNQRHLSTLIQEILTVAQSDEGRPSHHLTDVSAEAALDEVADMLQGAAAEQQMVLVRPPAGDVNAVIRADADRTRQILLNLTMNAIKYASAASGEITLSASVTPLGVALCVADNGPGIPEADLETIFEPFVQLASGLSGRRGGVGLGLAISRDLARSMGGDLTVQSTLNAGAKFTLTLPSAVDRAHAEQ